MKLRIATIALLASTAAASAADLPSRFYAKAPAPVPYLTNWTGFYVGAFGGGGFGGKMRGEGETIGDLSGGFGGGTLGYNWQGAGSPWVFGLEADVAGSDIKYSTPADPLFGSASFKTNAFGSVTGRAGWAFDNALLYVKGGYGWSSNKINSAEFSQSKVYSGYTVGVGAEYMFAPNWSAKVEYMYADYGKATFGPDSLGDYARIGLTEHTVKAGVNYHFNWGLPVAARY